KIVQYFKKELAGRGHVMTTDCSEMAPALQEADKQFIVPRVDEPEYLDVILSICKENNIKAVLSLIDPELSILAKHKQTFLDIGLDKYNMSEFLIQNGFKTVNSYIDKEVFYSDVEVGIISYPVFVKPVKGSASVNISKVISQEEVEQLFNRFDNLMIQELMNGKEHGVDVYIDML